MPSEKPSVLIVSEHCLSLDNGFGVTLDTLFSNWPDDKIGLFYTHEYPDPQYISRRWAFQIYSPVDASHGRRYALPMLLGVRPQWRSHHSLIWLKRNLAGFRPAIVYILMCSENTLLFGEWISRSLGVDMVVHVADDPPFRDPAVRKIIQRSSARFAISSLMAERYKEAFGAPFRVCHNIAASDYYRGKQEVTYEKPKPSERSRIIRYLGRIHSWLHLESLRLLGRAINELSKEGIEWRVELYGNTDKTMIESSGILGNRIRFLGSVSRSNGIRLLHTADLLVIPLTYQPEIIGRYALSFPTKLAEYLATGIPVLLLSSPEAASARFCLEHGVTHCITKPDISLIKQYLSELWKEPGAGAEQAERNIAICKSFFNKETVVSEFQGELCKIAKKQKCHNDISALDQDVT